MSMLSSIGSNGVVVSSDPYVVKREEFELEITMKEGYSYKEFEEAALMINRLRSDYGNAKPRIIFKEKVRFYYRKKYREVEKFDGYFLIGKTSGELLYSQGGKTGHYVQMYFPWQSVDKIILIHTNRPDKVKEKELGREKYFNRIQKARFDQATWSNLMIDNFGNEKPFYHINKVFDESVMIQIRNAFEAKKEFSYSKDNSYFNKNTKRHFSVSGKMCEDGIYRAWFSSEYVGYLNGDYYLLLNPEVAVFYEKD